MILDDNREFAYAVQKGLRDKGLDVDAFDDPLDAVKKFARGQYDLVLLDLHMPRLNGFAVYRRFRQIDPKVRVCFLTAFDIRKEEFGLLFPDVRVERFLKKPISLGALVKEVRRLLVAE